MKAPLLSVCLITYNHVKYIRQAIEGVLLQEVNFSWELIIADDYSTDGTREILLEFKNRYPDFISLILQEKNVGATRNWQDLLSAPKSKYIAYFEGDDYWTDPFKLQKQIDFLEKNTTYVFVFSDAAVALYGEKDLIPFHQNALRHDSFELKDLLSYKRNIVPTASIVYRNLLSNRFFSFVRRRAIGDWYMQIYLLQFGKAKYFNEVMCVYRMHNNGHWSSLSHYNRQNAKFYFYDDAYYFLRKRNFPAAIEEVIPQLKILSWDLMKQSLIKLNLKSVAYSLYSFIAYSTWR